jgi:hypothetical protein
MLLSPALELARRGTLYPGVILNGGEVAARQAAAVTLARTLLCEREPGERPCGACRHCRRIVWPGEGERFHPDVGFLERDLKTATSAGATRAFLRAATLSPFEARGQVFVVASAETLSEEAADALLKLLEEPPTSAPRHFLLLAPSRLDLAPTLRSRALAIYLGSGGELDREAVERLAGELGGSLREWLATGSVVHLLALASTLVARGDLKDPRATAPWQLAAAAVARAARDVEAPREVRARLLGLAEALLEAPELRLRAVPGERIAEGLVVRWLALPGVPTQPLVER